MYADIHCFPGKAAYDSFAIGHDGNETLPFDPWQIPQSNLIDQSKGKRANRYSQCDLAKSTQARVKLMFAALYPVEKGFYNGSKEGKVTKQIIGEYFNRIEEYGERAANTWLTQLIKTQPGIEPIKKSEFEFLKTLLVRLPPDRITFLQNGQYDYFDELIREYKFYLSKSGEKAITPNKLQLEPKGPLRNWEGVYQLALNGNDVLHRVRPDNNDVVIVLTIEGIHALGIGNPEDEFPIEVGGLKDVSIGKLKSRIRQLRGEESMDHPTLQKWEHRPFYITFAGHFNNTLCGHARSMPALSRHVYDQQINMDKGVLKNATYGVMRELLGLDDQLECTESKRILIDVKHMSASSRQDYYKKIIRPYNRRPENTLSKIPVIASQVGYSGIDSLESLIKNARDGKEVDNFHVNGFKAWNINLSDEDVIEIHQSAGLIGISLDQQLLGFYQNPWLLNIKLPGIDRIKARSLLARTIEQFVHIPFDYNLSEPIRIWDMLSIGTGFDGANNPMNGYATVFDMHRLEDDLIAILRKMKKAYPKWFARYSPEILARKICFENAYDFVVKHY